MICHFKYLGIVLMCGCAFEVSAGFLVTSAIARELRIENEVGEPLRRNHVFSDNDAPIASDIIQALQRALAQRSYYKGVVDGLAGEQTAEAIFLFQMDCELPLTGSINSEVLKRLNITAPAWLPR